MAEFFELLKKRRSIRNFKDQEVPLQMIKEIIKDSCLAPSAVNGQPWQFIVVSDRDMIKRLSDDSKENLLSYLADHPDSPIRNYETNLRNPNFNIFYNAPCLVFIGGSKTVRTLRVDCTLAACYFMFSASARGFGTCWIGLGMNVQDPSLLKRIGMPADYKIVAPIIIGYPKHIPSPPKRVEPQILKIVA
jgi:nitroreductase